MNASAWPLMLGLSGLLAGCTSLPRDALAMPDTVMANRALQSRTYETADEDRILAACTGVLQDLGFLLDASDPELGLIVGSKTRSALSSSQVAGAVALAMLGIPAPLETTQDFRVSVTTHPTDPGHMVVRVTFQRVVYDHTDRVTKREPVKGPEIYQEFFDRLSKAVFLNAQQL